MFGLFWGSPEKIQVLANAVTDSTMQVCPSGLRCQGSCPSQDGVAQIKQVRVEHFLDDFNMSPKMSYSKFITC
jgi:hypothetical protein